MKTKHIIAIVVLIVIAVAGWKLWKNHKEA